jgi:pentatricopeptide repeat protein
VGRVQEAHEMFDEMQAKGTKPGNIGYSILLSAYARVGQIDMVERLANEINSRENGKSDVLLFNTLLKVYCNACYMDGVMATLRKMDTEGCTPDRSTFNILIGYFAKEDLYDLALTTLQDMELRGHCANEATYNAFFQGLAKVGKVDEIWTLFGTMKEQGIVPTYLLFNTIICALLSHNRLNNAYTTFLELKASFCLSFLLICEVHTCVCFFSCGDKS